MPSRRLPRSHIERTRILRKASLKGNNTAPANHAVPAALWAKLNLDAGTTPAKTYVTKLGTIDDAERDFGASTEVVAPFGHTALQLVSHYFQVVDLAIARKFWPASVREYYGRDKNVDTLPDLASYDDALEWGDKIVEGDTDRLADGGTAMAMPATAEVLLAVYNLRTALGPHTTLKDALTDAEQTAANLLPGPAGIDKLILDLYNDVENHYRDLPDGARRDKCREWGLIYEGDPEPVVPPAPPTPPTP